MTVHDEARRVLVDLNFQMLEARDELAADGWAMKKLPDHAVQVRIPVWRESLWNLDAVVGNDVQVSVDEIVAEVRTLHLHRYAQTFTLQTPSTVAHFAQDLVLIEAWTPPGVHVRHLHVPEKPTWWQAVKEYWLCGRQWRELLCWPSELVEKCWRGWPVFIAIDVDLGTLAIDRAERRVYCRDTRYVPLAAQMLIDGRLEEPPL